MASSLWRSALSTDTPPREGSAASGISDKRTWIWSRRTMIRPEWVGQRVSVFNGRDFHAIDVTAEMVGHMFGDYIPTDSNPLSAHFAAHVKSEALRRAMGDDP